MFNSERIEPCRDGIAIIGMSGRFPGARTPQEFWSNLKAGKESIRFLTDEELIANGVSAADLRDPAFVRAAGTVDGVAMFDAGFFGYAPSEASLIDPQQRIFLECAWEAFEDAGYDPIRCEVPVGVFAGAGISTYLAHLYSNPRSLARADSNQVTMGSEKQYLTTRVAYLLNLRGPAITVQTACSTSLVAVHMAAQSLLSFESDMALAGAVLVCARDTGYFYEEGGILSPDGHNRSFAADAHGTVGGNGCGVILLKRLEDALRDGDAIRAVLIGSALNNDGKLKAGFTAPGVSGQAEVIARAQVLAGVSAADITYFEAHGSATRLGDPVEIAAMRKAFALTTDRRQYCALGSVKSNIGHLGEAAGMAGLIKTILALQHGQIPASLHCQAPNPDLHLEQSPFLLNQSLRPWEKTSAPRRAGVSSFGIGGTNAHVVLEEAPTQKIGDADPAPQVLVLSARSEEALNTTASNLRTWLLQHSQSNLADVAFTLQQGRHALPWRRSMVCRDVEHAVSVLSLPSDAKEKATHATEGSLAVLFLFPGSEGDCLAMASDLYKTISFFASVMDRCFQQLFELDSTDWKGLLWSCAGRHLELSPADTLSRLDPLVFAVEYALASLWNYWGIKADCFCGHGVGEYVAACLAGVMPLEEALTLVYLQAYGQADAGHAALWEHLAKMQLATPAVPLLLCATGTWITEQESTDPLFWSRQRSDSHSGSLIGETCVDRHIRAVLSMGRAGTQADLTRAPGETAYWSVSSLGVHAATTSGLEHILSVAGGLWERGAPLNWAKLHKVARRRVPLPTYPFERQRYWFDHEPDVSGSVPANSTFSTEDSAQKLQSVQPRQERHPRPSLSTPYLQPSIEIEEVIVEIFQDLLQLDRVGVLDDFFELGGDSLMAVNLSSRLREHFEVTVPVYLLLEAPNAALLSELVTALLTELRKALAELEQ